ncbi:MAG: PhzF family phenazine biosynthesis protein, partial [Candidatus Promineifilaceae bacterium]
AENTTRKVRIFTRQRELPFAGHPNIGTAFTLAATGELGDITPSIEISFEEVAGIVPMTVRKDANRPIWCELKAPETLSLGQTLPVELMADVLSLTPADIVTTTHPPQQASVGLPFIMTELASREALERIQINPNALGAITKLGIRPSMHQYVHSKDEFDIRARMFSGTSPEDPATGSANCALVGMLSHYQPAQSGPFSWRIAQGVEMGRPSVLDGRTQKQDGVVTDVWIAGTSVMVTDGYLEVGESGE